MKIIKSNLPAYIFYLVMATINSGCLDSSSSVDNTNYSTDLRAAHSSQYAKSIIQHSILSTNVLSRNSDWQMGLFSFSGAHSRIDERSFGTLIGSDSAKISSGFCVVSEGSFLKGYHATWFNNMNSAQFSQKGIGSNAKGAILSQLASSLPRNTFGYKAASDEIYLSDGSSFSLPPACTSLEIPTDSPVIITGIDVPQLPTDSVVTREYATAACGSGEVGHYLLSLDLTTLPDGTRLAGGIKIEAGQPLPPVSSDPTNSAWRAIGNHCRKEIAINNMVNNQVRIDAIQLGAAATNDIGRILTGGLNDVDCRQVTLVDDDNGEDDANQDDSQSYYTCSDAIDINAVAPVTDIRVTLARVDQHNVPCGGNSGTFLDTVNGFIGTATHGAWLGDAYYDRAVYHHEGANTTDSDTYLEYRERWQGQSIQCERQEDLNITCDTRYPSLSNHTLTDARGFSYRRRNIISGWADSVNLVPNDADNPAWNFRAAASGCEWVEVQTWGCAQGSEGQTQEGRRDRTHTAAAITSSPSVSPWNIIRPAKCLDRRVTSRTCPSGHRGDITVREERILTVNRPGGAGRWGSWTEVSRVERCECVESEYRSCDDVRGPNPDPNPIDFGGQNPGPDGLGVE